MDKLLSVVVPVHNAEDTLVRQVNDLMDFLPDLVARFEVLIVDDGSTDQTEDSAHELARQFPQLRVVRHARRLGIPGIMQTGLAEAKGDVVVLHDSPNSPKAGDTTNWTQVHTARSVAANETGTNKRVLWRNLATRD